MKNNGKIRSNFVKESLLDYNNLANTLKENTESAVKSLLKETVLEQYAKILTEDEDEDYDVEEVDDTDSVNASEDEGAVEDTTATDGMESDGADATGDDLSEPTDADSDEGEVLDGADDFAGEEASEDDGEGWSEFDKYKVSDGEYDFSNAEDDEIVKVYKLLKDDDQVVVTKNDEKVSIKDNETGAEYLIDLGGENQVEEPLTDGAEGFGAEEGDEFNDSEETDFENQEDEDMNESRIFEIALNEYNSNVGYTDNYQSKDVMTNPGMSEPGKNVNDWDAGVPKDSKKPWSGKKNDKSENQPFTAEKGKTVEEGEDLEAAPVEEDENLEEATNVGGFVQQNSTSKSHVPNSNGRSARSASKGGERIKGTATPRYDKGGDATNESIRRKAEQIFTENKQLKAALKQFRQTLQEAAITNVNLGNIIKLVMENATSTDEKKEIIARFGNEAKSVEASKNLYESISRDLQKKSKMNLDESKEYAVNENKQINETQIYRSNDILESLDLMHRICK